MRRISLRLKPTPLLFFAIIAILASSFGDPGRPVAHAAEGKPEKKDSSLRIKPKEVVLTPSVKPAEARVGETVNYQVKAKIEPGWHIYKQDREPFGDEAGPRNTTFDFFETGGLKISGAWTASKPAIRKAEPAFDNKVLEFFEDDVTWTVRLEIPPDAKPGKKILRCQVGFQICDARSCKIPGQWTLPDAELTVLPSGEAAAPPSPPPSAVASAPPRSLAQKDVAITPAAIPPAPAAPTGKQGDEGQATISPSVPASASATPAANRGKSAGSAPVSEVEQRAQQGLIAFLLFSAGGGLLALVMPCVWPMIPITVNFFVKQGHHSRGKTTGLAIAYCLAIIGVFTTFGVLVSFFFSATALQNLANNAWLNVAVAALFLAFGLSLLGLFEVRLPNFLLNASARGESRGGLVGVMFMALTLTITSFTCTFPVVGGLIVMAAGGQFFYPILGLATFSAILAFPFFLLALAPGLIAKMPRSGDWMNAVKVVGGLVEIGAALKFVNTAEISFGAVPEDAWFNAPLVLAIWVVLAAISGLYLLGIFRTDHDHDEVKVGPGRLVGGALFLSFALFLAPALFGRPPQSQLWYAIVGLFPPDVASSLAPAAGGSSGGEATGEDIRAVSTDPDTAMRQAKKFHGVYWGMSMEAAREQAKVENKPILIDFTGVNCANCRKMELAVLPKREVVALLNQFVTVTLYTDILPIETLTKAEREKVIEQNQELILNLANVTDNPYYVALSPDGEVLDKTGFVPTPSEFVLFLNRSLSKHGDRRKVAQATQAR